MSALFDILLMPLALLARLVCACPVAAIAAGSAAMVVAPLLKTASPPAASPCS